MGVDQRGGEAALGRQILHDRMRHGRVPPVGQHSLVSSLDPATGQGAGNFLLITLSVQSTLSLSLDVTIETADGRGGGESVGRLRRVIRAATAAVGSVC